MTDDDFQRRRRVLQTAGFPAAARPDYQLAAAVRPPTATATAQPLPAATIPDCLALIATRNHLPFAQIAARSFLTHHPEFTVRLLLVDGEPDDACRFDEGRVVLLRDLDLPNAGWYAAKFGAAEICKALKPVFLQYLAGFAETAIHLDCDTAVFSRLTELLDLLRTSPLVLLPHRLAPYHDADAAPADIAGADLVSAACFGIRLADCAAFLSAWSAATLAPGAFCPGPAYRTDQRHLNQALVTVPTACLLRESRYNLGYWNLGERDLHLGQGDDATRFLVGNQPLGTFHFSGFDTGDRLVLSQHDRRHAVYDLPAIAEMLAWYSDNVLAAPTADLRHEPYGFDRLANGLAMTALLRELLKTYETSFPRFDARTTAGADGLCAFLMDPLPRAGSMLPLVAAAIYDRRPDLQLEYPNMHTEHAVAPYWRWFCRHAGKEYDIQLLVDRFRRAFITGAALDFAEQVAAALGDRRLPAFFGADRMAACQTLRLAGRDELAIGLSEARHEVPIFTDLSAAFAIYGQRLDLQLTFPDILDRDREAFGEWLAQNAPREHGCTDRVAEAFRQHEVGSALARIFSYLARREDMPPHFQESLLLDDPSPVLRDLVRDAGQGQEYTLEDVVLLRFVHRTRRHLLVPLFLELPLRRQRGDASRIAEASIRILPVAVRDADWAMRGCEAHAACFDRFDAALDDAMRQWAESFAKTPRDVLGVLQRRKPVDDAVSIVEPLYRVATALVSRDRDSASHLLAKLKDRTSRPGVNIFGYFTSDIGVGESARGLTGAVSTLRPVNRIPLYTLQVRDGVQLPAMFQRFDYLSDTNVFVSYPHQRDDYLGMDLRRKGSRLLLTVPRCLRRAGSGAVDDPPGVADLDEFAGLEEVGVLAVAFVEEHAAIAVDRDVHSATDSVRRRGLRQEELDVDPLRLRCQRTGLHRGRKALADVGDAALDLGQFRRRKAQRFQFHLTRQQSLELVQILRHDRVEEFLAHFFRRDAVPDIDGALAGQVAAGLAAVRAEPAELVHAAVAFAVGLAVDFLAVEIEAENVEGRRVDGDEAAHGAVVHIQEHVADGSLSVRERLDVAAGNGARSDIADFHAGLLRLHRGHFLRLRRRRQGQSRVQTEARKESRDAENPHCDALRFHLRTPGKIVRWRNLWNCYRRENRHKFTDLWRELTGSDVGLFQWPRRD